MVCYYWLMEGTELTKLVSTIKDTFQDDPRSLRAIQSIGLNVRETGMPVSESALLARLSEPELAALVEKCPLLTTYFELQRLKYKRALLKVINDNATINKDIKLAQYLLEKNFSEEFDSSLKREREKNKPKVEDSDDVMSKLVSFVRDSALASPVNEGNTNVVVKKNDTGDDVLELAHLVHG